MARDRDDETLDDDARRIARLTDEVLAGALSVEPSRPFLSRVRQRVEAEHRRPARRPFLLAGLAAAAVVALLTGIQWRRVEPVPPLAAVATREVRTPAPKASEAPPPNGKRSVTRTGSPRRSPLEVIVDPREQRALDRFSRRPRPPLAEVIPTDETRAVLTAFDVPEFKPLPHEEYDVFKLDDERSPL
jgi:hypothetical protein